MNVTQEVVENNINKNKNLKPAFSEEKIKNILGKFGIIDKFDENFITPKDKKSVSLFEVKIKQKRNRNSNNKKKIKLLKKKGRKKNMIKQKDFAEIILPITSLKNVKEFSLIILLFMLTYF